MGSFVAIEGLDGCGKSTQINLLIDYLIKSNLKFKYIHFPRLDTPVVGEMISMFLRGEFGNVNDVHPQLVALMYSVDRQNAKDLLIRWIKENDIVIVDRYVYSNIAFQCAKTHGHVEKTKLKEWIISLEFGYNKIPKPDLSLFLNSPIEFIEQKLKSKRIGNDREYLKGSKDIHEESIVLQSNVKKEYLDLIKENEDFCLVNCSNEIGKIFTAEEISLGILEVLKRKVVL